MFRPYLVHVGLLKVGVLHLGGVAAGGAHVDLQTDHVPLLAQSRLDLRSGRRIPDGLSGS